MRLAAAGPAASVGHNPDLRERCLRPVSERLFQKHDYFLCRFLAAQGWVDASYQLAVVAVVGRLDLCQMLLRHEADAEWAGSRACRHAAEYGHIEVLELLLKHGARANAGNSAALASACLHGNLAMVKLLLDHEARPLRKAMELAAENGHASILQLLLDAGEKLLHSGYNMPYLAEDLLLFAARGGHATVVQLLVQKWRASKEEYVERIEFEAMADALSSAVSQGSTECVRMLLEAGVFAETIYKELGHAVRVAGPDIVELLLQAGADPNYNAHDFHNYASLYHDRVECLLLRQACHRQDLAIVRLLLDAGAQVDACDNAALVTACKLRGNHDIVELLLQNGAVVDAQDGKPLAGASEAGNLAIVEVLLNAGATPCASALRTAAKGGHSPVVRLLLQKGADVRQAGSALEDASKSGHMEVVGLLLEAASAAGYAFDSSSVASIFSLPKA